MDLEKRFNQVGGEYYKKPKSSTKQSGGKKKYLSPKSENWKKKYLLHLVTLWSQRKFVDLWEI